MPSPAESIRNYIRAKDDNRPYLMPQAFTAAATLRMIVNAESIAFPPLSTGIDSITEVLVRRFAQKFENVFTFCLGAPPCGDATTFACDWLVGMSEKDDGAVRVGCGRYEWMFARDGSCLVDRLEITVAMMQVFERYTLDAVIDWLSQLPYPWCPLDAAMLRPPQFVGLDAIVSYIARNRR